MHEIPKDEPIFHTQNSEAHNRKISAVKPLLPHLQAHRNRKVSAICLYLCLGLGKSLNLESRSKILTNSMAIPVKPTS